ncbi:MAG: hypothetical protein JW741_26670 [Sedimentisphaerales bacterium]|nr:hypothetical protein [Sedimentisphaerales bacterium]
MAEAGALAPTRVVTIRSVAGEKYDSVTNHQLGPIPPRFDGGDEHERSDLPTYAWAGDEIPF